MRYTNGDFVIDTDKSRLNISYVHQNLARSYWSENIPIETVKKSIEGSICFGVYHKNGQIGFARIITDSATFAYIADVFIDENYPGKGLGK